jgi:hypothetical protein
MKTLIKNGRIVTAVEDYSNRLGVINNKILMTILLTLYFSISALAQTQSISKDSIVVPKFAFKWSDLNKSWRGFLSLQLKIEQNNSGNLTINGNENWRAVPIFPAYEGNADGLEESVYRSAYLNPSIVAYKVSKIDRKKELTEVNLSKLNDRLIDLKLQFGSSVKDVDKALKEVLFLGGIEEFKKSDFYQSMFGSSKELAGLPQNAKASLLEDVNCQSNGIRTEIFKEKKYLVCSYTDGTEYNSNLVNQAERTARTIQKYLPLIKRKGNLLLATQEIEGVELQVKIAYRNFINETQSRYENLQFYVPLDSLKLFIELDITDQELVDKSIVILNDSRVRVNLSQFSN